MTQEIYPPDWITHGYSRINGEWIEVGYVPGVHADMAEPELTPHQVAAKLNELECRIEALL